MKPSSVNLKLTSQEGTTVMKNLPLCGIFQVSVRDETMQKLNLTDQTSLSLAAHGEEVQKLTLISHHQIGFATSMFFCSLSS